MERKFSKSRNICGLLKGIAISLWLKISNFVQKLSDPFLKLKHVKYTIKSKVIIYLSHAVSNFYGTEIEIWAGFGLVGWKKIGPIMSNF